MVKKCKQTKIMSLNILTKLYAHINYERNLLTVRTQNNISTGHKFEYEYKSSIIIYNYKHLNIFVFQV